MLRTIAVGVLACAVVACGSDASDPGASGSGGVAGASFAGVPNANGGAGASSGGSGNGVAGNSSGASTSNGGTSALGGAPTSSGGIGGAAVGAGGVLPSSGGNGGSGAPASGGSVGAGGVSPDGGVGDGGQGGAGGAGDRCDVGVAVPGKKPGVLAMSGDLTTHDPCVIEESGIVYEFHTGPLLPGKTSTDLAAWKSAPSAFSGKNPAWIASRVPGATDLWAPDLSFFGGVYHLYYAASSFGSNTSCIGHATREHMSSGAFTDHGAVICSSSSDDFNAIDPNAVVDTDGNPWLAFGSFWSGIKIVKLDMTGARADDTIHSIASRNGGAIEASFIARRCGYYYLFVSFDKCCAGAQSTYNIRVGRSADLLGPYVDASGKAMMNGGGTLLVGGGGDFAASGGSGVLFRGTAAYNVFHAYPLDGSAARLRVAELVWGDDGWPISGGP
ncbi:MAG TPA: arabinan endo-1,5-alpha-L-arabinosidase [Polyangiaceae bacterium]|nr:arabinan endo-1,5-alpha-L-arabinosidase [Polyangiaceae bacterium]